MGCLCCGASVEVGSLCRSCAQDVPPCEGLIPDHLRSNVETTEAAAWVVDGFGVAHAVAAKNTIGRKNEGELVVLASSVSREHAELRRTDAGWTIVAADGAPDAYRYRPRGVAWSRGRAGGRSRCSPGRSVSGRGG